MRSPNDRRPGPNTAEPDNEHDFASEHDSTTLAEERRGGPGPDREDEGPDGLAGAD
jgi:hypothetical protein